MQALRSGGTQQLRITQEQLEQANAEAAALRSQVAALQGESTEAASKAHALEVRLQSCSATIEQERGTALQALREYQTRDEALQQQVRRGASEPSLLLVQREHQTRDEALLPHTPEVGARNRCLFLIKSIRCKECCCRTHPRLVERPCLCCNTHPRRLLRVQVSTLQGEVTWLTGEHTAGEHTAGEHTAW